MNEGFGKMNKTLEEELKDVPFEKILTDDGWFSELPKWQFYLCKLEGKIIDVWYLFKYKIIKKP